MGFQARKSFKVIPGVRMTLSKSGVSTSVGVRGARVTRTASGRVTRTIGVPGTGVSHTRAVSGQGALRGQARQSALAEGSPPPPKPALLAPRWEKRLHAALVAGKYAEMEDIARSDGAARVAAATLEAFMALADGFDQRGRDLLDWVWVNGGLVEQEPFIAKYASRGTVTIGVVEGVSVTLPLSRDAVGFALIELLQDAGEIDSAIRVAERLDPSIFAAVSLAELYGLAGRHQDVIELTNGIRNEDDPSAILVAFRGRSLSALANYTAAREAFKEALKSTKRAEEIRLFSFAERAKAYLAEGKPGMARKDLERIMAVDATYPGLTVLLAETQ